MSIARPNVLLITTDQQRFDAMRLHGNAVIHTPNLDALAVGGVDFTRAYITCPVCIPARRTLMSGLHPSTHGLQHYEDGLEWSPTRTLPQCLRDAGYQTELVGKLHLAPQRKRYGFEHIVLCESATRRIGAEHLCESDWCDWLDRETGGRHPSSHGLDGNGRLARPWHLDEVYHHTNFIADRAIDFIERRRDPSCPWFLHLSFVAPHPPLCPPAVYFDRYKDRPDLAPLMGDWASKAEPRPGISPTAAVGPFPRDEIQRAMAGYYGLVEHVDAQIGHFLQKCFEYSSRRAREPLWILFSSDHGEMLGDHHLFRKSLGYEGAAHVPFFITGRNLDVPSGTCDALVGWEDVMPTILDLAGVPVPPGLDGSSLVPLMRGEAGGSRETIFGCCGPHHFLVQGLLKYILHGKTGEEQVFDLGNDPGELHDLSADSAVLHPLRSAMLRHLRETRDAASVPSEDQLAPCGNRPPTAFWPSAEDRRGCVR